MKTRSKRTAAPSATKQKVFGAPSKIDGMGAFAGVSLAPRKKIGEMEGERITIRTARRRAKQQHRLYLVELDERWAIDGSSSDSPLKFVNHGCQPNTFLRVASGRLEFYALRRIRKGEELTANYGDTHHRGSLRCRCGADGCIGFI
jgi:SET domain-containing protein